MKARNGTMVLLAALAFSTPGAAQDEARNEQPTRVFIEWTDNPGAFEMSLKRRYNNPLFAPSRRRVSEAEHRKAVIRDAAAAREALDEFMNLALRQSRLERLDDPGEIRAAAAEFSTQIRRDREIGGEASKLAVELDRMRSDLFASWRKRNAGNSAVLAEVGQIERNASRSRAIEQNDFVAQMLRRGGPIDASDLAPSLLSEDPETIRLAMRVLDADARESVRRDALAVVSTLRLEGREVAGFDERLDALSQPTR